MGVFDNLVNSNSSTKTQQPVVKLNIPSYPKPVLNPDLKISAPTGKELTINQLPTKEKLEAEAATRESNIRASGKKEGFFSSMIRSFPRAITSVAADALQNYNIIPENTNVFTPKTNLEKFIYGEEPVKTSGRKYEETKNTLEKIGAGKYSSPLAFVGVLGGTLLDLFPFTPEGAGEDIAKRLAKTTSKDAVEALLRKHGVAEDLIKNYADDFVKASTKDEVQGIFRAANTKADEAIYRLEEEQNKNFMKAKTGEPFEYHGWAGIKGEQDSGFRSVSRDIAQSYSNAKGGEKAVQKSGLLKNPFVAQDQNEILRTLGQEGEDMLAKLRDQHGKLGSSNPVVKEADNLIKSRLSEQGYDGVMYQLNGRREPELQAFNLSGEYKLSEKLGQTAKIVPSPEESIQKIIEPIQKVTQEDFSKSFDKVSSYLDDASIIKKSQGINTSHLNISDDSKKIIEEEFKGLQSRIEERVGRKLTNKEAQEFADNSSKILTQTIGRKQTLEWEGGLINLRQRLAAAAESGQVNKEFLDDLVRVKTIGTDIGRKLQSFSIAADAKNVPVKQFLLEEIMKFTNNTDEILRAAQGVNLNDYKQAVEFYRQFVKPKAGEWLDLLRYNSMLSSPLTHIVNTFSNLTNSLVGRPLTKLVAGGLDLLKSTATGEARQMFAGEAGSYISGYLKNFQEAVDRFAGVWSGAREFTNLDLRKSIPLATKGIPSAIEKTLSVPLKLLEGADQFFSALSEGGERAALNLREAKGVAVKNVDEAAKEAAQYTLYRSPLFKEGQGTVLDAIDSVTQKVLSLRNSENPIVSTVAKFTVPFVSTPMNIFKQGIEHTPIGFLTAIRNTNKTEQFAKALIGTGVGAAAGTLIASNRMTWGEPTSEADRNAWRENGMQPYSVKLGNKWYSYQKLPPFLSFPLSMVAAVNDAVKTKKMNDTTAEFVLSSFAKYSEFLADQSYFKSIGDFFDALSGNESGLSRLIGNYPQQLVPYRALGGWITRLTDNLQRQADSQASFIDKQMQLLMMNIPYASQYVPARQGASGQGIPARDQVTNSFSPVKTSSQTPEEFNRQENIDTMKKIISDASQKSQILKEEAITLDTQLTKMTPDEANTKVNQIKKDNPKLFDKLKEVIQERKLNLTYEEKKMNSLGVDNGDRARYIISQVNKLSTTEEKNTYIQNLRKKKIISNTVMNQLQNLK